MPVESHRNARIARLAVRFAVSSTKKEMIMHRSKILDRNLSRSASLLLAVAACLAFTPDIASAQLAPNQTQGFGNGRLVTFTYLQNFDCLEQPSMDLDFNNVKAQSDPNELQTPICQPVTEPTQDPTGGDIKHTAHLYVFVPMFSVDNDQNPADAMPCPNGGRPGELCGIALGQQLISSLVLFPRPGRRRSIPPLPHSAPTPIILYPARAQCTLLLSILTEARNQIQPPQVACPQSVRRRAPSRFPDALAKKIGYRDSMCR